MNAKTWKSCFCLFTDGKQHESRVIHDMITRDLGMVTRDLDIIREFKHDVYGRRQTAIVNSDFLFFSCNPYINHTKIK